MVSSENRFSIERASPVVTSGGDPGSSGDPCAPEPSKGESVIAVRPPSWSPPTRLSAPSRTIACPLPGRVSGKEKPVMACVIGQVPPNS